MIKEELNQESKSWFVFVSVLGFAVVLFFSVFYEIQTSRYEREIADITAKKQELTAQNKGSGETDRARAVSAKSYLKDIEKKQVIWSKIVEKMEGTIPRRADTLAPVVTFRSYNGSSEGRISVNATTQPDAVDPFTDISFTIKAFSGDQTFKNVFVPSISRSITPDGQSVITFSMNFEYDAASLLTRARVDSSALGTTPTLPTTSVSGTVPVAPVTPLPPSVPGQKPATPVAPASSITKPSTPTTPVAPKPATTPAAR